LFAETVSNGNIFHMYRSIKLVFVLLLLTACQPQPLVPTLVPAAVLPDSMSSNTAVDVAALPGTFTPAPNVPVDGQLAYDSSGNLVLLNPSGTPYIPTSTPRPVVGPATRTRIPTLTPTYFPSPIPAVNGINPSYPTIVGSKLGIHVIRNNDPEIMRFVRQARPAVIKVLDDLGFTADIKEASPGTIIVGRVDELDQRYQGVPEEAARAFVQKQLNKYLSNTAVDYWEGWNEADPNLENMRWYARFEQERVREMARYGLKTAVGGFATGVPELDEFALFVPAIETAIQFGGILTLHEYGAPDMTYLFGSALPGYPSYPDRGALTFRYRWYYREILEPAGLAIPLIITEAGIDGIIGNRPGPDGYGWADFQEYAVNKGWGSSGVEAFINQLAWYDAGVRQDPYVLGFTIFTAGPVGHWRNYDINPILPDLTRYVNSQR
jgi:hypothetical protein